MVIWNYTSESFPNPNVLIEFGCGCFQWDTYRLEYTAFQIITCICTKTKPHSPWMHITSISPKSVDHISTICLMNYVHRCCFVVFCCGIIPKGHAYMHHNSQFPQTCCSASASKALNHRNLSLQWHNKRHGVSNHRQLDCLLKRLFRRTSKKTSKLRVTGLRERNPPVTGRFSSQRTSNAGNVSIWLRHHGKSLMEAQQNKAIQNGVHIFWDIVHYVPSHCINQCYCVFVSAPK